MPTLKSTIDAPHLSGKLTLSEDVLSTILEWVSTRDTEPRIGDGELNISDSTTIGGYTVEMEYFTDSADISIRESDNESVGVLLTLDDPTDYAD